MKCGTKYCDEDMAATITQNFFTKSKLKKKRPMKYTRHLIAYAMLRHTYRVISPLKPLKRSETKSNKVGQAMNKTGARTSTDQ